MFFPERTDNTANEPSPGLAVCATCSVQEACLVYALVSTTDRDLGIWGGTTTIERKRIRKSLTPEDKQAIRDLRMRCAQDVTAHG